MMEEEYPTETSMFAPENGCLEYDPFLFGGKAYFQGRTDSFREGKVYIYII